MDQNSEHHQAAKANLSSMGKKFFHLIEFDENEKLVTEIRKHPFGLFLIDLTGAVVAVVMVVVLSMLATNLDTVGTTISPESLPAIKSTLMIVGIVLGVLSLVVTFISMIIYRSNVIFVTTEKIAQVLYSSIISRKISQLSIGDVQDVTVHQNGIFARIFNFGTLVIETAGEQQNYTFTYVPKPYENARSIVGAHEENLKKYGN